MLRAPNSSSAVTTMRRRLKLSCHDPNFSQSDDYVESTAFSSCGKHLISATTCGNVRIWNTDQYSMVNYSRIVLDSQYDDSLFHLKRAFFKSKNPNKFICVHEDDSLQNVALYDINYDRYQLKGTKEFVDCNFNYIDSLPEDLFFIDNQSSELGHMDLRTGTVNALGQLHESSNNCRLYTSERDPFLMTVMDNKRRKINVYDRRYMFSRSILPVKIIEVPVQSLKYSCFNRRGSCVAVLDGQHNVWVHDTKSCNNDVWEKLQLNTRVRPIYFIDCNNLLLSVQDFVPNCDVTDESSSCDVTTMIVYNLTTNCVINTLELAQGTKSTSAIDYRVTSRNNLLALGLLKGIELYA